MSGRCALDLSFWFAGRTLEGWKVKLKGWKVGGGVFSESL